MSLERAGKFGFAARLGIYLLLLLWPLFHRFYRDTQEHGFVHALVLFAFIFLIVEILIRADRRLRHRKGIPWVSRLYYGIFLGCVAAVFISVWYIVTH
jgi:hypothetical protein